MDTFSYKGISDGKYVEGEIEALNQENTILLTTPHSTPLNF